MTWMSATTEARVALGATLNLALCEAEGYMREAEAQHAKVKADPFFTEADRRASLTKVTLSHRALALLRPLAEMLPAVSDDSPFEAPVAHRVVHPPAPAYVRAPESVVAGLASALWSVARVAHYDLHIHEDGALHLFVNPGPDPRRVAAAMMWTLGPHMTTRGDESHEVSEVDDQLQAIENTRVPVRFSRLPVPT